MKLNEALKLAKDKLDASVIPYEKENAQTFKSFLRGADMIIIALGDSSHRKQHCGEAGPLREGGRGIAGNLSKLTMSLINFVYRSHK
ncbi:hypothetical protein AN643_04445 [Candidatus Epulonipiscioides saccharophilum]|nr:hypothetical protein AN643_04445 [Epulopiscium sp. SCG-B10WGA-EpuloB]